MDLDLRYFVARGTNQGRVAYQCYLCRGQTTTDQRRHCRIEGHQNRVRAEKERLDRIASQRAAARVLDQTMMVVDEGISQVEPVVDDTPENHLAGWLEPNVTEIVDDPPIIPLDMFNQEESGNENDDDREELLWMQFLDIAIGQISSEPEGLAEETSVPSFRREEEKIENVTPDNSIWFPFLNKEYMIALLLVGYLHKIISRDLYHQIRAVFTVYHIQLPRWEAVRQMRATIRSMSNHSIIQKESVFNQPMFGLDMKELIADDLMNPLVAPHLEFVPEEAHGTDIYKFRPVYQLKDFHIVIPIFFYTLKDKRVAKCYKPIIRSNTNHSQVEIHIPPDISFDNASLQTLSVDEFSQTYEEILLNNGLKLSNCCQNKIFDGNNVGIPLPNPWRKKANKKVIRNIPINLYCDDTSGNKSKKWNKHISYYFTLAGLPPKISNQQFNCHFLCTSNIATPLELGEMVVEQLNDISTNGFVAYDSIIGQEVLVMTSTLSFLADSPMHAEITNTHVPGNALNSCRYCVLRSKSLAERKKMPYVAQFAQKNLHGSNCPNQLRTTEETSKNSEELWTYTKETLNPDKLDKKSAELAVRDQINLKFSRRVFDFQQEKIALLSTGEELPTHMMQDVPQELLDMEENELQRMFNPFLKLKGFDTVRDTPVEVLHVFLLGPVKYLFQDFMKGLDDGQKAELLALWISFNTDSLNIPSIRPTSMVQYSLSLVGKDFRIILQAAPFIFFQFMTPSQINIWSSLCHLGSLIFQTHIENMETYILELRNHIDIFLKYIIQDSAQWVNKAKFHMLLHLPESILRYGPASLFATEKFESYNGILRNASIHSNRQSPGQDIAITFSNYHTFRQIISGGFFFDKKQKKYIQASNKVTCIFTQNPLIQQMLGYNQSSSLQNVNYPFVKKLKVPDIDRIATPGDLQNSYPDHEIKQISELQLNGKQVLKKNYFILFNVTQSQETQHIGSVNSIWKVEKPSHQSQFFINTTIFQKMGKNDFYKMREIRRTPHSTFVNLHSVKAGLNAQHNCQHGECKLTATKIAIVERQKSTRKTLELTHTNNERYIVNLASLSSIDYHRKFSDIPADPPSPLQWLDALHDGLKKWGSNALKKVTRARQRASTSAITTTDPDLMT
ncbi:hypothetical protein Pst134EA_026610 [Puccinia striiformis f. sp. tritici]|nr:hypothetical protein Pst134EA_026610 [Puccinia striiformis f. sp. tritici]KAH9449893.1 hypothetical protein Pst134EA_026610 [Puccinia striiformis f. sp. tritici]